MKTIKKLYKMMRHDSDLMMHSRFDEETGNFLAHFSAIHIRGASKTACRFSRTPAPNVLCFMQSIAAGVFAPSAQPSSSTFPFHPKSLNKSLWCHCCGGCRVLHTKSHPPNSLSPDFLPFAPAKMGKCSGFFFLLLMAIVLAMPSKAQFLPFQDTIFDPSTPQSDPLRKVFGIWGRLLNRMAQQNPPSDDELHLRGATEGGNSENVLLGPEEEIPPSFRRAQIAASERRSFNTGPDRIIDEGKLNELLPRLNPNQQSSSTTTTTSTSTTTTSTTTSTTEPSTTTTTVEVTTSKEAVKKKGKSANKKNKKKNKTVQTQTESTSSTTTTPEATTTTSEDEPSSSSASSTVNGKSSSRIPPMTIIKDEETQKETSQVLGATIRLSTSAEKGGIDDAIEPKVHSANLTESVLARMENETAQLISEIENVLADAEVGPNGGHWLREEAANGTTSSTDAASSTTQASTPEVNSTTEDSKSESESEESSEEESGDEENESENEDGDEEKEDEDEEKNSNSTEQTTNSTSTTNSTTTSTPTTTRNNTSEANKDSTPKSRNKLLLPEAEEEEQVAEIAQLQLDSTASVSTASPIPITNQNVSSTTSVPISAQNVFNLNSNANANANPNFSTMIRPINSVIDGIGPLILPLIGYSRQALDAYSPYSLQRAEGVSIFRPTDLGGILQPPRINPSPQQIQVPHQAGVPIGQRAAPIPLPRTQQQPVAQPAAAAAPNRIPDPPSLELLGRIIEQRRQKERERLRLQEVSGSSPASAEQKYFPPVLNRPGIVQTEPVATRPPPSSTTKAADDQGYDAGRKSVLDTFHEDSGLMLGQRPAANGAPKPSASEIQPVIPQAGNSGFGGGRQPSEAPFAFAQ